MQFRQYPKRIEACVNAASWLTIGYQPNWNTSLGTKRVILAHECAQRDHQGVMMLEERHVAALLVAALSVNSYSEDRVQSLLPELRRLGLTSPRSDRTWDAADVIAALEEAGYQRGRLNWIIGPRVQALMSAVQSGDLEGIPDCIERRDQEEALQLLVSVPGVGPKVAGRAWALMEKAEVGA